MSRLTLLLVLLLALLACSVVSATPTLDQVKAGVKHVKSAIASLDAPRTTAESASMAKLRKLTAPKVDYYHETQKTVDREVDLTARAVISNPTRDAYLRRVESDKQFAKTVSSAASLLKAHNKFKPMVAPKIGAAS